MRFKYKNYIELSRDTKNIQFVVNFFLERSAEHTVFKEGEGTLRAHRYTEKRFQGGGGGFAPTGILKMYFHVSIFAAPEPHTNVSFSFA